MDLQEFYSLIKEVSSKALLRTYVGALRLRTFVAGRITHSLKGKIERIHRTLRSKMEYDILKMGKEGVNWAKMLPEYQTVLNNDPFEIYFAREDPDA